MFLILILSFKSLQQRCELMNKPISFMLFGSTLSMQTMNLTSSSLISKKIQNSKEDSGNKQISRTINKLLVCYARQPILQRLEDLASSSLTVLPQLSEQCTKDICKDLIIQISSKQTSMMTSLLGRQSKTKPGINSRESFKLLRVV